MKTKFVSDQEVSRGNWGRQYETDAAGKPLLGNASSETIAQGLAQRSAAALELIAKSSEAMAQNFLSLQADAALYKKWWQDEKELRRQTERRESAQKGVVTRLQKRIKELEQALRAAQSNPVVDTPPEA